MYKEHNPNMKKELYNEMCGKNLESEDKKKS